MCWFNSEESPFYVNSICCQLFRRIKILCQSGEVTRVRAIMQFGHIFQHSSEERDLVPLNLYHMPVSVTFGLTENGSVCFCFLPAVRLGPHKTHYISTEIFRSCVIVDPTEREELCLEGTIVVGANKRQEICALHCGGNVVLKEEARQLFLAIN